MPGSTTGPKVHHMARYKESRSAFEFTADLEKAAEALGVGSAREAAVELALVLHAKITEKTPVDTGRARANWFMAEGAPVIASQLGTEPQSYTAADLTGTTVIFITNALPYIVPLEYGHSGQAPYGMVRVSIAEVMASIIVGRPQ